MYKVAEYGNTEVKNKYLKIVLKYSTWVNVFSHTPSLFECNDDLWAI